MRTPSLDDRFAEIMRKANEEALQIAVRRCFDDDVPLDVAAKVFEQAAKNEKLAAMKLLTFLPKRITAPQPKIQAEPWLVGVKRKTKKRPSPVRRSEEERAEIKATIVTHLLDSRGYIPIKQILDKVRRQHPDVKEFLTKQLVKECVEEGRISKNTNKRDGEYIARPQGASSSVSPHMRIKPGGQTGQGGASPADASRDTNAR